jgi:mitochondrial fission protein ELM1
MTQLLVVSDAKPGHVNQSLAFAVFKGLKPQQLEVRFRSRFARLLSYLFDRCRLYPAFLLAPFILPAGPYAAVVCAGSETYYAARLLARRLRVPVVAVMLPSGYRYAGFNQILAQEHDHPPRRANILSLPINLCHVRPQGVFTPQSGRQYVGIVLGGPNKVFTMETAPLRTQLKQIFAQFADMDVLVATSRRTPADIEALLTEFPFAALWLYSEDPVNPIPDFLAHCEQVFISSDSTSMISEAVSYGSAAVEVLPLPRRSSGGKFDALTQALGVRGCLHIFDGSVANCRQKIDLPSLLKEVLV